MEGICWHVHHDILIEYCYDYDERVRYIRENKPEDEIETRLRLFKKVKGDLPTDFVEARKAYDEAYKAYNEAWKAYGEALKTCDEARKTCTEAKKVYGEAHDAYVEAQDAYVEVQDAYDEAWKAYGKEIEELHAKECPDCPWNGETIFP